MSRVALLILLALAASCSRSPEPRPTEPQVAAKPEPSPFDINFWHHWTDGKVEVCTYKLSSGGTAITATRVDAKNTMHWNLLKRDGRSSEELSVALSLDATASRPAGSVTAVAYSNQNLTGQSWSQLQLGPSRGFVTRHSVGESDIQQIVDYYPPGFTADALMLWARRIAWPRLEAGTSRPTELLGSLTTGERLTRAEALLSRTDDSANAVFQDGSKITFVVHKALPHHIHRWTTRDESAELIGCQRVKPSYYLLRALISARMASSSDASRHPRPSETRMLFSDSMCER